jgi:hypothetical protein
MKSTAKDWDEVRSAFASSIMVDTALTSLAQNLDAPDWPIKGKEETPSKYIDLPFDEVTELLQLKGQKPERIDQLVSILKETLAFDSPFGEMVTQTEAASARDNPLLKNLAKLGIPENFPMALTALDAGTLEFCKLEKLVTLSEFAVFAQGMSQSVIVGGDFRKLLNALSNVDEATLAEVLPFRRGAKGLHLVEAVAQAAKSKDAAARVELATTWFRDELAAIEQDLAGGGSLARQFIRLGDAAMEARAAELLKPHVRLPVGAVEKKKSGFFGRLFGKYSVFDPMNESGQIRFPSARGSGGNVPVLSLRRRPVATRSPFAVSDASAAARETIKAVVSATRAPFGSAKPNPQSAELERTLRQLELTLADRERSLEEHEARLADRERDLAEMEALLIAREKLVAASRKAVPAQAAVVTPEEKAALELLRAELERQEASLKEAKQSLREREQFLDESETKLFEKVQQQQEKEIELEQRAEDLAAREQQAGMPPPAGTA